MVEEVRFSLGKGSIAGSLIIGDSLGVVYHLGKLGVGSDQILIRGIVNHGIIHGVVSVILAIGLLAQEVHGICKVSSPTIDENGCQLRNTNFVGQRRNVSQDVQLYVVIAQAIGEDLRQRVSAVLGSLVVALDIVVNLHREGHALSGQLFHGLCLVSGSLLSVNTSVSLVGVLQAQFVAHHLGIVHAFSVHSHSIAGIDEVLARQGVDGIGPGQVRGKIQTVVPTQAESLISNRGVPVGILGAVLVVLVIHQVNLIGVLGGTGLGQVVVELMGFTAIDGGQCGLGQRNMIQLAGLEQVVSHVLGLNHLDGHGIEALDVGCIPVVGVCSQDLLILVHIGGYSVGTGVPHVLPGDGLVPFHTHFFDQLSRQRIQAVIGGHGREVAQLVRAGINDGLIVGSGDAHHFLKHGSIKARRIDELPQFVGHGKASVQNALVGLCHVLGVIIVLSSTNDHFHGHRGVGGAVLGEIQNPLQTGDPVLGHHISLLVAVFVNPLHAVIEHESPGLAAILGVPILGGVAHQCAMGVVGQQTVDQVA